NLISTFDDGSGPIIAANAPPASALSLNATQRTHSEAFNVYVNYSNDFDMDADFDSDDPDQAHPENPNPVAVTPVSFSQFRGAPGTVGHATLIAPYAFGSQQFLPVGQPLPYTIQFQNAPKATTTVGEVRVVSQLDPNLDPRTFRLGDLQLGNISVHIPANV